MKKEPSVDQLLRNLENDSITNSQKANILGLIIDIESEKPEADMDLIQECFDYLELLKNSETEIAARKERIPYHLQRSHQKAADESAPFKSLDFSKIKQHSSVRKHRFYPLGIAAAIFVAILVITMTSLTVIARKNGYKDPWEWLSTHLNEYFQLSHGEQMTADGITVIRDTDFKTYVSIESWLKEENLNILYPTVLPDGIKIDKILQSPRDEGEVNIIFLFNSPDVSFMAQNYDLNRYIIPNETPENMELIEANGYQFGVLSTPAAEYHYNAYGVIDNFVYVIGFNEQDTLLTLINHLKGIES